MNGMVILMKNCSWVTFVVYSDRSDICIQDLIPCPSLPPSISPTSPDCFHP